MGGGKNINLAIERIATLGGHIDVGLEDETVMLGVFTEAGGPYIRFELGGVAYIDDLIGALRRVRRRAKKAEG